MSGENYLYAVETSLLNTRYFTRLWAAKSFAEGAIKFDRASGECWIKNAIGAKWTLYNWANHQMATISRYPLNDSTLP